MPIKPFNFFFFFSPSAGVANTLLIKSNSWSGGSIKTIRASKHFYIAVHPPSTKNEVPVIYEEALEAKNKTDEAISSGLPSLFNGQFLNNYF